MRLLLVLLLISSNVYAQNAIALLRPMHKANSAILCRNINVPMRLGAQAIRVAQISPRTDWVMNMHGTRLSVEIERKIAAKTLRNPIVEYGPYKQLKAVSRASQNHLLVNDEWADNWKHIHTVGYYQGAHHLINKSTIKMIYRDLKEEGEDVHLNEMETNAPAIFHPLHGAQEFKDVFHNSEQQYYDYKLFGMKVLVISLLERIDEVGMMHGFNPFPQEYLEGVLKEAELWCKYYGMKWE